MLKGVIQYIVLSFDLNYYTFFTEKWDKTNQRFVLLSQSDALS